MSWLEYDTTLNEIFWVLRIYVQIRCYAIGNNFFRLSDDIKVRINHLIHDFFIFSRKIFIENIYISS